MIVYDGLKTDFLSSCEQDTIAIEIEENILTKLGKHTPKAEFRSWENSLNYMYKVLNDDAIPSDAGIAIEFNIPQTSKRVDFMISGYGEADDPGMVIVELKQWESLTEVPGTDALVETFVGGGNHRVVHPSYQAWSYAQLIMDYNQEVQDRKIHLSPCACLHNYIRHADDPLDAAQYKPYLEEAPAYT
ncbi:MAG: ATP-binding protein, partial [Lachnospiraceae bacterium]|nr:ATP-binding protein [Lachnospiraceae bacterium]